jgi:hypothetical protein
MEGFLEKRALYSAGDIRIDFEKPDTVTAQALVATVLDVMISIESDRSINISDGREIIFCE